MNFCDLDQGREILRKPFGPFLGRCCRGRALHCPEVSGRYLQGRVLLQPRCLKPSRAPQRGEGMLWKRLAGNNFPAATCGAIDAAGAGRCRRDGSALAGAGLCRLQVGSAQCRPRQGSGQTRLQRLPGQRQLEIPGEGRPRLCSLARV